MNIKAQAAKNVSGTIRKIDEYNRKTISTKTVKVNASNAINQINTLLNKINSLPRTKTITVKVSQNGNLPKVSKAKTIQSEPVLEAPINEVSSVRTINEVSQINSSPMSRSVSSIGNTITQSNELGKISEELSEINNTLEIINNSLRNDVVANLNNENGSLSKLDFKIDSDIFNQFQNIMKEFTFKKISSMIPKFDLPISNIYNIPNNNSNSVNFNSPLIVVEGNVDKDVMFDLEKFGKKLEKNILDKVNGVDIKTRRLEGRR